MTYADVEETLSCSNEKVRALVKAGLLPEPQWYEGLGLRFWGDDVLTYLYGEKARRRQPPNRVTKSEKAGDTKVEKPPVNPKNT